MTYILDMQGRISRNQFKCNYLKIWKLFVEFSLRFWNLHQILNFLKEKMSPITKVFPKLFTPKRVVT